MANNGMTQGQAYTIDMAGIKNKITQIQAITIVIDAINKNDCSKVSTEVLDKLKDIKESLEKKNKRVSKKALEKKEERYNKVKAFFTAEGATLTSILLTYKKELAELEIFSSQALLGAIKMGVENGEIVRTKEGKTVLYSSTTKEE